MSTLLLLLLDSRAPAGANHHSGAMEAAVSTGLVTGLADLEDFCRARLRTSARVAAAFAAAACRVQQTAGPSAGGPGRPGEWALLDAEFDARTPSEATRAASRQLGGGLRRLLRSMLPDADLAIAFGRFTAARRRTIRSCWARGGWPGASLAQAARAPRYATMQGRRPARRCACSAWTRSPSRPCWPGWLPISTRARPAPLSAGAAHAAGPVDGLPAATGPLADISAEISRELGGASLCVLTGCLSPRTMITGPAATATATTSTPACPRAGRRARVPRIGIGGPVGSGKTALVAALCRALSDELTIGVVTNDIYTTEDADFLRRAGVLPDERIRAVQTGACPHTAIRDDISANLDAVEQLEADHPALDLVFVESGGDNLTATFSYGLVHRQIFVIDVAGGDKVPRKGGPGVTRSDLLVINKTDLAAFVGADLGVMARDAAAVRGERPTLFTSLAADPAASQVAAWVRTVRSAIAAA